MNTKKKLLPINEEQLIAACPMESAGKKPTRVFDEKLPYETY